jgi:hypothetical protein
MKKYYRYFKAPSGRIFRVDNYGVLIHSKKDVIVIESYREPNSWRWSHEVEISRPQWVKTHASLRRFLEWPELTEDEIFIDLI